MANRLQEKIKRKSKRDKEPGADYYVGFSDEDSGGSKETSVPYKLEPNASEIEDFLTRLRQEGL